MFTGIVRTTGKIKSTQQNKGILTVSVSAKLPAKLGESLAVNGVCSTVARKGKGHLIFEYMPETLRKTNLANLNLNEIVNIEPSLRRGDPIDGHFVTGHIDTVGRIVNVRGEGESKVFSVSLPKEFWKYIVYKGSVTVDGVALTISKKVKGGFEVSLIPYTLANTNLNAKMAGDTVNVECDIIAKYIYYAKRKK
jgi:riboflavin synthase